MPVSYCLSVFDDAPVYCVLYVIVVCYSKVIVCVSFVVLVAVEAGARNT